MNEPSGFKGVPIVWVPELPGGMDWSKVTIGHGPWCRYEACQLKKSIEVGSTENPLVIRREPRPS